MDKRYQVFVSSTYIDLIPERSEVMQALLELECMPAGMELFPAANDSQWDWIKKVIDESDYYMVIIGGRYGSISKESGLSYTEMEYRYALESGKPVMGFMHEDISKLQTKVCEQTANGKKRLNIFRDLVGSKLCKMYSSPQDLGAKVSRSITQMKKQHPAVGWIRANALDSIVSADDMLKLKEENEELKARIYRLGMQAPDSLKALASGAELFEVHYSYSRKTRSVETGHYRNTGEDLNAKILLSWDEMLGRIGPELIKKDKWSDDPRNSVEQLILEKAPDLLAAIQNGDKINDVHPSYESMDAVMIQFKALNLITIKEDGIWELTPYGENYVTKLLAVPKGKTKH